MAREVLFGMDSERRPWPLIRLTSGATWSKLSARSDNKLIWPNCGAQPDAGRGPLRLGGLLSGLAKWPAEEPIEPVEPILTTMQSICMARSRFRPRGPPERVGL